MNTNKFVVAVFPDETKAYEGLRALDELHREGSVTLYGTAVVQRDPGGKLSIKQRSDEGPLGTGVGALTGGLIGLFGGPVGAAVGLFAGGLAGSWRDYLRAEVSDEFLEGVERDLKPGKFAVIAEVSEEWVAPVDARMEALGGTVVRERREDFIDDVIERRADSARAELAQWETELAGENAERMESKLNAKLESAQQKLQRSAENARKRLDQTKEEVEAKLKALEEQAAQAKPEVRDRIQQRTAELRKDFEQREKKLTRAYELSQEALQ